MKRFERTTISGENAAIAIDLVGQQFRAPGPDHLWIADVTDIRTWSTFLCLAMVLDMCSRRVVG